MYGHFTIKNRFVEDGCRNYILKKPSLSAFLLHASQYWKDSRLLFLYLIDKLLVFNPDFRAAA